MKNIIILLFLAFSISACANRGHFIRAEHNGKIYWLPPECETYRAIPNSDNIICNNAVNEIKPTPSEEYEAYLKERELRESRVDLIIAPSWGWYYGRDYYYGRPPVVHHYYHYNHYHPVPRSPKFRWHGR